MDRIRFRFVDAYRDTVNDVEKRDRIDLTGATALLMKWTVNGVTQSDKTLVADVDQVTNPGLVVYDFQAGDLTTAGELRARAWFTDSGSKVHKSVNVATATIHEGTP